MKKTFNCRIVAMTGLWLLAETFEGKTDDSALYIVVVYILKPSCSCSCSQPCSPASQTPPPNLSELQSPALGLKSFQLFSFKYQIQPLFHFVGSWLVYGWLYNNKPGHLFSINFFYRKFYLHLD